MAVVVRGVTEARAALARVGAQIVAACEAATDEAADALLADMRERVPVLTGQTRDELEIRDGETDGTKEVGLFESDHGAFPEFGTEDTPAQPFITPAGETERQQFEGRVAPRVKAAAR